MAGLSGRARWWLFLAGVLPALGVCAVAVAAALLGGGPPAPVSAGIALGLAAAGVAAGAVPAVRRVGLRVLVTAAAATAVCAAIALGLLVVLLVHGRPPMGAELRLGTPALVGVVAAAVLAGPLARRAARAALAVRPGNRRSADDLLAHLADAGREEPADDLLRRLAEALRREHRLAHVEIWASPTPGADGDLHRCTTVPHRTGEPAPLTPAEQALLARSGVAGPGWLRLWVPRLLAGRPDACQIRLAPAVHGGRVLALLVVERGADAELFTGSDERALAEVARRLAAVLRSRALDEALGATLADLRRTNAELQASRSRLVSAADSERRRIERDLHDGAQQHLVALAVGLRLVRDGADAELLDELDRGVRESISALRDLAHGIYPPLLRASGLGDALRTAARRNPLAVEVRAAGVGRHPEPVEAAVYFCCLEALQNAAKHATGATVVVTLDRTDDELRFAVADTGPGFDAAATGMGSGLQNMADRLGAVGGTVDWRSTPGLGTTVTGVVPLAEPAPAPVTPSAAATAPVSA